MWDRVERMHAVAFWGLIAVVVLVALVALHALL